MTTHESLLLSALSSTDKGRNVDFIGPRLSGRSWLVQRIAEHTTQRGQRVLFVRGSPVLTKSPLGALGLAGIQGSSPFVASTEIERLYSATGGLVIVDDWDYLDDESWAALLNAHMNSGLSIVATRAPNRGRAGPFSVPGVALANTYELPMLDVPELGRWLKQRFNCDFDTGTVSTVAGLSGGNIGIAAALVEAAFDSGSIVKRKHKASAGERSLWTRGAESLAESILALLSPKQRDALEAISTSPVSMSRHVERTGRKVLSELVDLDFLGIGLCSDNGLQLSVRIPLLDEYHRRYPNRLRMALEQDSTKGAGTLHAGDFAPASSKATAEVLSSAFVRSRRAVRTAERKWKSQHTLANAVALLRAQHIAMRPQDEVERVFNQSRDLTGDDNDVLAWELLNLTYALFALGDAPAARERLNRQMVALPHLEPFFLLGLAITDVMEGREPDLHPDAWDDVSDDPVLSRAISLLRMSAHLLRGDITAARVHYDELIGLESPSLAEVMMTSMLDIADGEYCRGSGRLEQAFRQARDNARLGDLGPLTYAIGLLSETAGNALEAQAMFSELVALGMPAEFPRTRNLVNAVAVGLYDHLGQPLPAELAAPILDGALSPFPGSAPQWQSAALMASSGDRMCAGQAFREHGHDLWARGYRLAASFAFLRGGELDPLGFAGDERLLTRLEEVSGIGTSLRKRAILAIAEGDDPTALALAADIGALHQRPLSAHGWMVLSREWARVGEVARAQEAAIEAAQAGAYPTVRGGDSGRRVQSSVVSEFSEREREVVRYIVVGLTNAEIADALVLSKRTVENHVMRAMRKAGVTSRQQLRAMF